MYMLRLRYKGLTKTNVSRLEIVTLPGFSSGFIRLYVFDLLPQPRHAIEVKEFNLVGLDLLAHLGFRLGAYGAYHGLFIRRLFSSACSHITFGWH